MVRPRREWYLPSISLHPSQTHHLLAQRCLACQSPTPGTGIHSHQTYTPAITNPIPHTSHKDLPDQNSKEFKLYRQGRVKLSSLKKREKEREVHSPSLKELQTMEFK